MIVDAFPFHDEFDILEMRLVELYETVDWFVLVEADVTHQDDPKPYHYLENAERFAPWADKIIPVQATGLPTLADDPDPWAREVTQREHIVSGLARVGVDWDDIVMQSDVDEIPRPVNVRQAAHPHRRNKVLGDGFEVFGQRGHFWAVDWLHPEVWRGTVAGSVRAISRLPERQRFRTMRELRGFAPCLQTDAGWHFSWLGGPDRARHKLGAFCHPEYHDRIAGGIDNDNMFWRDGFHTDGKRMRPVEIDNTWPRWIRDGNAPDNWYRPREVAA